MQLLFTKRPRLLTRKTAKVYKNFQCCLKVLAKCETQSWTTELLIKKEITKDLFYYLTFRKKDLKNIAITLILWLR